MNPRITLVITDNANRRIYDLEMRVANLEEILALWVEDFKQKLDIKTLQSSMGGTMTYDRAGAE
jgi:phosphopantetheine adenylyltransferase